MQGPLEAPSRRPGLWGPQRSPPLPTAPPHPHFTLLADGLTVASARLKFPSLSGLQSLCSPALWICSLWAQTPSRPPPVPCPPPAFSGNQSLWVPEGTGKCAPKDVSSSNPTCECGFIWNWGFCRRSSIQALDLEWTPIQAGFWDGEVWKGAACRAEALSGHHGHGQRGNQRPSPAGGASRGLGWQGQQVVLVLGLLPAEWHGQDLLPRLAELVQSIRLISDELGQSLNLSDSLD